MRNVTAAALLATGLATSAGATVTTMASIQRSNVTSLSDVKSGPIAASSALSYGGGTNSCRCSLSSSSSADMGAGRLAIGTSAGGNYGGDSGSARASARLATDIVFSSIDPNAASAVVFTLSDITAATALMANEVLTFTLSGDFGNQTFTQIGSGAQDYAFSFTGPSATMHLDLLLEGGSHYPTFGDELTSTATIALRTSNATYRSADGLLSAVPEPASWAIMVGGFGLVGAAIRRRRATGLVSA